jgi:hypothetical protein
MGRMMADGRIEGWGIIKLDGLRWRAGFIRDVEVADVRMLSVEIASDEEPTPVEYWSGSSVRAIRMTTEDAVRALAGKLDGSGKLIFTVDDDADIPF